MLGKTHLQQLIPQRLTELAGRLEKRIWTRVDVPVSVGMTQPRKEHLTYAEARKEKLRPVEQFPFVWGRMFEQAWFKLKIPARAFREGLYLYWDDEGEATLYADGLPWYGFDAGHHRAPLPARAREIWIEGTCVRTGVWVNDGRSLSENGSTHRGLSFWKRDEQAWEMYWDYRVLLDLMEQEYKRHLTSQDDWNRGSGYHQPVFRVSPLFRRLMRALDAFADAFDHDGCTAAPMLKRIYRELPADAASLGAILTGHAHLDLVWLWPESIGESKAVHLFSTANRLMEAYPEFCFGYSQPASYDAVERRSPQLMRKVREKIRSGQWEAVGASDVESDTQLPCGEALARGFVIGQERFKELQGRPSRVLWLPDVFGYSACIPQILQQTGVSWFFTTKLTWSTLHRFPYSSFRWRGHDGSEVLVHVSQEAGYNGDVNLRTLRDMQECQQEAGIHNEFLVPTGYGDGGGGPSPEILERARRVKDLCGVPRCSWGRIEDFFERLEPLRPDLPEWQGELYLEYHRGVQTTHGDYKAAFRAAERALQFREAAHSLNRRGPIDTHAWRRVIFCQFHDAIPGSSIREVYEEQVPELHALQNEAIRAGTETFTGGGGPRLFNPLGLPRKVLRDGRMADLAPLSCREGTATRELDDTVRVTPRTLRNRHLKARFSVSGEISTLEVDGEPVILREPGNQIWLYPDHPHEYPAWDIDRGTLGNGRRVKGRATATVEAESASRCVLAFSRKLTEKSSLVTRYILEAESPVLGIEWEIDWQDPEVLLKSVFPTGYNGSMARFGAPFGSTLRSQHSGETRTEGMYEVPGSRWAVISDDGEERGLTLVTEAKYGFTARGGSLGLSLLKSAFITRGDDKTGIRDLRNPHPHSDIGQFLVRGAVTAHRGGLPRERQPAALAETLYQPVVEVPGAAAGESPFLGLEGGETLIPVWVQPNEDGSFTVRLNETMGRRGTCRVKLAKGAQARIVDLLGNPMPEISFEDTVLTFSPYALLGLKVTPPSP